MTPEYEKYIAHYGIKGQKHGVRRFQNEDGSLTEAGKSRYGVGDKKNWKRLNKDAKNDAHEYAVAKAYYGDGAGTRRKKINNIIKERSKDPDYRKEFERQLSLQNSEKNQYTANRQRKVQDAKESTMKTVRGVKNFLTGNAVPMTTAAIAIGATLKYTGAGKKIAQWGKTSLSAIMRGAQRASEKVKNYRATKQVNRNLEYLRRNGPKFRG